MFNSSFIALCVGTADVLCGDIYICGYCRPLFFTFILRDSNIYELLFQELTLASWKLRMGLGTDEHGPTPMPA